MPRSTSAATHSTRYTGLITSSDAAVTRSAIFDPHHTKNSVAVLFSGWLGVTVLHHGRGIREALVDPLSADVYVAGTYLRDDCEQLGTSNRSACADALWNRRLSQLHPIAGKLLEPMPTLKWLQTQMAATRHWRAITKKFNWQVLYQNLSIFSPVLGTPYANVLRELLSYERAYALLCRAEQLRGAQYAHLLFSRLEYSWLAPHPPISAFYRTAELELVVWAPIADANGMNDRHALMPRPAGAAYFQRWSALLSSTLAARFDVGELVLYNPETFLKESILRQPGFRRTQPDTHEPPFRIGEFALPAYLACCGASEQESGSRRCWAKVCYPTNLLPQDAYALIRRTGKARAAGARAAEPMRRGETGRHDSLPRAPSVAQLRALTTSDMRRLSAHGKYEKEMRDAVITWRWMQCLPALGAADFTVRRSVENPSTFLTMQLVVHPGDAGLDLQAKHDLTFVLPNRSYAIHAPSRGSGDALDVRSAACPLTYLTPFAPPAGGEMIAAAGWCDSSGASLPSASPTPPSSSAFSVAAPMVAANDATVQAAFQISASDWKSRGQIVQDHLRKRYAKRALVARGQARGQAGPHAPWCAGTEQQATLSDCAHACVACRECAGLHFSYDLRRCSLHRTPCYPRGPNISIGRPPLDAPQSRPLWLQSPDGAHGWDVVALRRDQLHAVLGADAMRAALGGLTAPRLGHCGPTEQGEEGDCDKGDKGSLPFGPKAVEVFGVRLTDDVACVNFCKDRCKRCNFVTISHKGQDCSWYSSCKWDRLEREPTWLGHKTFDVGSMRG